MTKDGELLGATKKLRACCVVVLLYACNFQMHSGTTLASDKESTDSTLQLEPLDAALPEGKETDPLAIHAAQGATDIPNREMVENLKGKLTITPHNLEGLAPKRQVQGVFKVAHAKDWPPPDAAGTGPFYLVKENDKFFVLTEKNFAEVYGPVEREEEVLPYLKAYGDVFLMALGNLVTRKEGYREGTNIFYPKAPAATTVRKAGNGFRVRLVYYTIIHRERFSAVDIVLQPDGTVKKTGEKVIKDLGPGIFF